MGRSRAYAPAVGGLQLGAGLLQGVTPLVLRTWMTQTRNYLSLQMRAGSDMQPATETEAKKQVEPVTGALEAASWSRGIWPPRKRADQLAHHCAFNCGCSPATWGGEMPLSIIAASDASDLCADNGGASMVL
ncbi:hypothetical protein CC78DRAFT_544466 [Lojkania enalia]|uniref:Uncharacterized protein n=1 Tax=Lojkania enalia TaxID=147567 RepID=A0A9P4N352_9PLEO|nr:hypothetical protein CC78DRAFT_544466 [Didymosphaeria enalia]